MTAATEWLEQLQRHPARLRRGGKAEVTVCLAGDGGGERTIFLAGTWWCWENGSVPVLSVRLPPSRGEIQVRPKKTDVVQDISQGIGAIAGAAGGLFGKVIEVTAEAAGVLSGRPEQPRTPLAAEPDVRWIEVRLPAEANWPESRLRVEPARQGERNGRWEGRAEDRHTALVFAFSLAALAPGRGQVSG